jgi:hypothetical protein
MSVVTRIVLIGLLCFPASVLGGDIELAGKVTLVRVPNGGEPVAARTTGDGVIHLLYNSGGIPYYVKSRDGGRTFSSPIPVVDQAARKPKLVFAGESMAIGKGDAVFVAMSTNNWQVKLSGAPDGLVYATLAPGAKSFTPVRSLNQRPSQGFSLAAHGKGDVAGTWLSGKLYVNFSRDGGRTFTPDAEINPAYLPCECCTRSAVYGNDGNLALIYRERTNNERDIYLILRSPDGRETRRRLSSTLWKIDACPMTYYTISATPEGYVAAWPTKSDIYIARLDAKGNLLTPGEIKTPGRSSMRSGVVALGAADGESLVAWNHEGELGWQLYDRDGQPEGQSESAPGSRKGAAGVLEKDGHFILFQ